MKRLRSYRYRNDQQISEFLQQLFDGDVQETNITREGQSSKGGALGLRGVGEANVGTTSTSSESYTVASTPVSRAVQLEEWLGEEVQPLSPMDPEAFAQVEKGEFIRFEGTLEVPEMVRMAHLGAAVGRLAGLVEVFGSTVDGAEEMSTQVEALQQILRLDGFPIVAKERLGGPGVMFIAQPDLITGEPMSLHQEELTVLGRVKRTIPKGERLSQSELLPSLSEHLPQQNRQQRRSSGKNNDSVHLEGPAVLVEPIAIYA